MQRRQDRSQFRGRADRGAHDTRGNAGEIPEMDQGHVQWFARMRLTVQAVPATQRFGERADPLGRAGIGKDREEQSIVGRDRLEARRGSPAHASAWA